MNQSDQNQETVKELKINWYCDNNHPNSATIDLDSMADSDMDDSNIEDIDSLVENLCSDPMFVNDNPCHICGDTIMQEIDSEVVHRMVTNLAKN